MGRSRKGQPSPGQQTHGTEGGYQMHMQRKTTPCFPCSHAVVIARAEQRRRGRCESGLGWPLLPGAAALAVLAVLALAACGTVHGHAQPGRILPALVPNAVPFTGPLPSYGPAGEP